MSGHRKNGADDAHAPGAHAPAAPAPGPLDVAATLAGKRLLVTGATGFVGKVTLTLLLDRYPDVGTVYVLLRPGTGGSAEARFFDKVIASHPFDPLRARHGAGFDAFVRARCVPVAGDVSDPLLGLSEADLARLAGIDAVVNCAGLVDFDPSLELALGVNVHGAGNAVELCRRTGAALLHMSTCFVAGNRDGVVYEDEDLLGYYPRREGVAGRPKAPTLGAAALDVAAEIADCERRMAEVRARAEDRVEQSLFRDRALARLREEGRGADEKALRLAIAREKRVWSSQRLVEAGMERARHWGWPNTYTYTKSLGEQVIAASGLPWTIVRPSIVESALRYPFPGWNEGFTTSAPLAFLALEGARGFPAAEKAILDVVPVDLVAGATIAATAELVERRAARPGPSGKVVHLASGDVNPLWARRAVELTALYRRRYFREREEGNRTWNRLLSRIEPYAVTRTQYEALGAPALSALARGARRLLGEVTPRWGAPRLSALAGRLGEALDELESQLARAQKLWDLFMPFLWENKYVFRCAGIRDLYARLSPEDRGRIPWDPDRLDWRRYWLDVHMKGLEEWVFPGLEEQSGKRVHAPRAHRDLLELLEASCERWSRRVALRLEGARKDRLTYGELRRLVDAVAGFLHGAGVARGDRVLLACENRPEWAVLYFGILRAGAAAVPVDPQLSAAELVNLWRTAGARVALLSEETSARHPELPALAAAAVPGARAASIAEALAGGPPPPPPKVSPDDLASLIFTSGTTGTPKGVMLSHRNFASLVGKLSGVFDLGPGDGLLSVLPLHHTFEFTAGLLVPLSRGAEIEYLDELTADRISDALSHGRVTAMIGVPALWALLHRRITQELAAKPGVVEGLFHALSRGNAALRDSALGLNLGKLLFWPVHRRFGGRLRLLVSGGSALDPDVQKAFRELGFDLYEGYGLTEAAPVLAVSTPGGDAPKGSVGPALPGIELRIADPDASGVGEVLARGPNVMLGYWRGPAGEGAPGVDPALTRETLEDGWLRTGDLGRLDADGNLTLVGRKKDVIIDANGKNVYPDEVEDAYRDPELVKELCVVGLPDGTGEKVAMLLVPDWRDRDRAEVRARLEAHVRAVSAALPFAKRVKVWHLFEGDLPKTATRKVKRPLVRDELLRIEAMAQKGRRARDAAQASGGDAWLLDLLAEVTRRPRAEITPETRLATDLGFDSLMITELGAALEEAGVPTSAADDLRDVQTVGELARRIGGAVRRPAAASPPRPEEPEERRDGGEIAVPGVLARLGRKVLSAGQRALYEGWYEAKVRGTAFVPHDRTFLVVANHASHLDMGLVKVALGDEGARLAALAARDYFFDTPVKRAYFENFTNLIPMEREGSLRTSLRAAAEALRRGHHLLIFPEGTRSRDGALAPFFPTAGYLALHCGVDVLPAWISGTHEALPPGKAVPRRTALAVRFGPVLPVAELRRRTEGLARSEAYRAATAVMEEAVKALRDAAAQDREPRAQTAPASPPAGGPAAVPAERGPAGAAAAAHPRGGDEAARDRGAAPAPAPAPGPHLAAVEAGADAGPVLAAPPPNGASPAAEREPAGPSSRPRGRRRTRGEER